MFNIERNQSPWLNNLLIERKNEKSAKASSSQTADSKTHKKFRRKSRVTAFRRNKKEKKKWDREKVFKAFPPHQQNRFCLSAIFRRTHAWHWNFFLFSVMEAFLVA